MPTTTTSTMTATMSGVIPLKAPPPPPLSSSSSSSPPSSPASPLTTLRSLYPRAARSFLHREVALTVSLLSSAFSLISPPSNLPTDPLASHRRKWDLLRITLETTIYASTDPSSLPPQLRATLNQSPHSLITGIYARSLNLFTPLTSLQKPNPAFLPTQILVTLVLSSLKLGCPDVGRGMIEDWLARRGQAEDEDAGGYEKVLEIYCLHVLPRLTQWEYAQEFLEYESELASEIRERMKSSLRTLQYQSLPPRPPPPIPSLPKSSPPSPSRTPSPAPSSSSSSSLSTTSTHTAVPRNPRQTGVVSSTASTASDTDSNSTATVTRPKVPVTGSNGNATRRIASTSTSRAMSMSRPPRSHPLEPPASLAHRTPSTFSLIRTYLQQYLSSYPYKLTTILLVFMVFPILSFFLRVRRRRIAAAAGGGAAASTVDVVRRRLAAPGGTAGGTPGLVGRLWGEVVKAIGDTIRMGGSGLV